ncbi:MAG: T9SS type A sorting domain-containing protein [Bacteroidetes bacterium]|nr:T9SS type A sorting domain-containing protein [Bacteroidota bacterium]
MKKSFLPSAMTLLILIFSFINLTSMAQQPVLKSPAASASLTLQPDVSGLCIGAIVTVPVHITGDNVLAMDLFLEYNHSVLTPSGSGIANVFPGFNALFNYTYLGYTNTSYLGISANGLSGANFTGEKIIDLLFVYHGGSTSIHFRKIPDIVPPPLCTIFDEFGGTLSPVDYTDNLVSGYPNLSVGTISPSQTICTGTIPALLQGAPPTNGTSPTFQWQSSTDNITFANINGATLIDYQPAALTTTTYYRQLQNATNTCTGPLPTNTVTLTVKPYLPVSISIAASANPVCSGTAVTFTATPVNGGLTPSFQWKVNGINSGTNSASFSYTPLNSDAVTCDLNSSEQCMTGNPATSNTVTMVVNPMLPVGVAISTPTTTICAGALTTFTAIPTNGGTTPAYQWKVNGTVAGTNSPTLSYVPANNDFITCTMASSEGCTTGNPATSNTLTMTVNPLLPVSVSISASANSICAGIPVTFTATPVNGGLVPVYQWKVNGTNAGTGNPTYTFAPANNDQVTCELTSGETCVSGNPAISNTIAMVVNPLLPVSISIAPSANPVCLGTSVTYTATPVNGGVIPSYQWKVNGIDAGAGLATFTYVPANNDLVTCVLTSGETCVSGNPAISNTVTMTVNPMLPVSVSVVASANPVCAGSPVTYTATPTNGGLVPAYQWQVNGTNAGTGTTTYTYVPANSDIITCILTSSDICVTGNPATSNAVTMTLTTPLPVSVSIVSSANPVCAGTSVTFTATPTNGGLVPAYQWKVNGTNAGTGNDTYSYVPANNDVVTCELTSGESCVSGNPATSNPVTMTVNPLLPVSVSIVSSLNPVCAGTSVTFTATPTNGGLVPAYQWKVNGTNAGTGNATYSYVPANNDFITCELTSNETCVSGNPAMSNTETMIVNPLLPVSIVIAPSANPVCAGVAVTFTATPTNGGLLPAYQWKVNGTNAGTGISTYTYVPANNDLVTCELLSGETCVTGNPATSNTVTMAVNPLLPVSVSIIASGNPVCDGTTVTFTATPTNGGLVPAYQWKVNGTNAGTDNAVYSYVPANNDAVTCELTSSETCVSGSPATSNIVTMAVNPLLPVSISIAPSANSVCPGTSVTFTATPVNGGVTPAFLWLRNGIPTGTNSATYTFIPVNNDVVSCVLTTSEVCFSGSPAVSNSVTMIVNPVLPVSVSIVASANPVCAGSTVTFTATPVNGGLTPSFQWKVNGVNAGTDNATYSYVPAAGDLVVCELTSGELCVSGNPATSNAITINITPNLIVGHITADQTICSGSTPELLNGFAPLNGTSPTYQWQSSLNNLTFSNVSGATMLDYQPGALATTTYYRQMQDASGTCGGPLPTNTVTMTVNPVLPASVTIAASANGICAGTSVTFTATPVNGGLTPAFQWLLNGTPAGTNSATYSVVPANNDIITCVLTSSEVCVTGSPATSNSVTMTVNPVLPVSVSIVASANPVCAGDLVVYTATPVNGGTLPVYQWMVNGANAGTDSPTYSYSPANNDVITCVLTSGETCVSGNPATSNPVTMSVTPALLVGHITADQTICSGTTPAQLDGFAPLNGTSPTYQWQSSLNNITFSNISGATLLNYQPNALTTTTYYRQSQNATGTCGGPLPTNTVTISVNPSFAVGSIGSDQSICTGITPALLTGTAPTGGSGLYTYQWQQSSDNITFGDVAGATDLNYQPGILPATTYFRQVQSGDCGGPLTTNVVTITVTQALSVGSITLSQSICSGSIPNLLQGVPPANGTLPTYQWQSSLNNLTFGNISGATMLDYQPGALTTTTYYRQMQNATGTCGGPLPTNTVTVTVSPLLPVSVSVSASANPVCAGTPVTFTATPTNGGVTPVYQWKVNGTNAGTGTSTYSYSPAANDVVTCVLTSDELCVSGNPATSNAVTMVVNPILPVSVSIVASANPVCAGGSVTFTATPVNGGTVPAYQWTLNGANVGTGISTYSFVPADNDVITCVLTSSETCVSGDPATSNTVTMSVIPSILVGHITADQTICSGTAPAQLDGFAPLNGTSPTYQWQSSLNNVTFGNISGATLSTYQPGTLSATTFYRQMQNATGTCGGPVPTNTVTISVNPSFAVGSIGASQAICSGVIPAQLTGTAPTGGDGVYTYQWQVSTDNVTFADISGGTDLNYQPAALTVTTYYRQVQTGTCGGPLNTNTVTITIDPPLAVGYISANQVICSGTAPAQLDGFAPSNGTNPTYQWQSSLDNVTFANINGATALNYQPGTLTTTTYYLQMQNASGTCGGPIPTNVVTITVTPLMTVGSISADQTICFGTIPAQLNGTAPTKSASDSYQWQSSTDNVTFTDIPGANGINYQPVALTVTTYFRQMQDKLGTCGGPLPTNVVTITVTPDLAVGSISANQTICANTAPALLIGVAPSNGTSPTYQWQSSLDNVTFANINGATALNYQPGVLNTTTYFLLLQNATGTCGGPLATNVVTITTSADPVLAPGTIGIDQTICSNTAPLLLNGTPPNGTAPTYQWQSSLNNVTFTNINGATTLSYQPGALTATTYYHLVQDATGTCGGPLPTNVVTITVTPDLIVGTISANQSICAGNTPALLTGTAPANGTAPTYQWQSSLNNVTFTNITGATTLNYQPGAIVATTYYRQQQNATGTCGGPLPTNVVTITFNPNLAVGSISANQAVCPGVTPALLTGVAPSNGTSPTYQWQNSLNNVTFNNIPGATSLNYQPGAQVVTTYYRQSQNAAGTCGGPLLTNVVTISINPNLVVGSISASQSICAGTAPALLNGFAPSNGTTPTYQWQSSTDNITFTNISGATLLNYQPGILAVTTYFRLQQNASGTCGGPLPTNVVTITVNPVLTVGSISANQAICSGSVPAQLIGVAPTGSIGPYTYQWQNSPDNITFTNISGATTLNYQPGALTTVTYYRQIQSSACGTPVTTNVVTISINALPVPTITGPASVCVNSTGNIYSTQSGMTGYTWAVSAGGIITAGPGTSAITVTWNTTGAKTVTVNYTNANNCTASTPTIYNVTVNPLPVPTIAGPSSVCVNSTSNVYTTETGMTGYTWTVSAGGAITAGAGTNVVTVTWSTTGAKTVCVNYANANGCSAASPVCYNVTVNALPVPTITGPASVCVNSTGNVYSTQTGMTGYTWTVSAGGAITAGAGTSAVTVTWSTTGAKTVCVNYTNANGCSAASPVCYNVTVNALPVPTIAGPASVCLNSTGNTYTTQTGMTGYTWTVSAGGAITAGAGTSAITVTWSTIGAKTVCVNYTNANGCTAATPVCYNVTVNALPTPTITGPASVCVNAAGNVYTTQTGNTGYVWTVTGGTITAGQGTSSVTVTWTTAGAQTVCVNYANASLCTAAAPVCYNVTVNAVPTPTITGPNSVCQGASATYTTQTGMTNYVWVVSGGGTITAGGTSTSNTVTVTWNTVGAQTVTVNYTSVCPGATPATYNVTVNAAPVPTIGSTNNPCVGSTNNIYYTESGMTGYIWGTSGGGVIVSGQGTSTVNITWNQIGIQTVTVNYSNAAGCFAAQPTVYTVFVNSPPNAAGAITGTATVCAGTNGVVYSTTPIVGATSYSWTVPAGATIVSGLGTTSITVSFGAAAVTGVVTVAGTNQCGNGPSSTFAVTVNPLPAAAGTITGPASVCAGSTGIVYTVPAIANATSYVWTVPAGATITSGGTTNSIVVSFGNTPASGIITVKGTNTCGSGAVSANFNVTINAIPAAPVVTAVGPLLTSSIATGNQWYYEGTGAIPAAVNQTYTAIITGWYWSVVTVNGCSSDTSNHVYVLFVGQEELTGNNYSVYPIPNDGRFNVSIHSASQETYTIQVFNLLGEKFYELKDATTVGGTFDARIDLGQVARGIYSVVFLNSEHRVVKKMIVNR